MPRRRNEKLQKSLGSRLQQIRLQRGLTQDAVAEAGRVSVSTIARYETGRRGLSLEVLTRIATALNLRLPDLLDVDEPTAGLDSEVAALWGQLSPSQRAAVVAVMRELAHPPVAARDHP
jgi:transcriptional regulator with XRE-family HTH domain